VKFSGFIRYKKFLACDNDEMTLAFTLCGIEAGIAFRLLSGAAKDTYPKAALAAYESEI
jgi:hypothetical protein